MRSVSVMSSGNRWQVFALLCAMAALSGGMGYAIAGPVGFWWALCIMVLIMIVMPGMSADVIARLYKARPLRRHEAPVLYDVVEDMLRQAEVPIVPVIQYMPSQVLNAFTVGKGDRLSIVLSSSLVDRLTLEELIGVLAHEVSHIVHEDILVMTMADVMSRVTSFFSTVGKIFLVLNLPLILTDQVVISWWLVGMLIFAPSISVMMQLALSRGREFEADRTAVALTLDPLALASALQKIDSAQRRAAHWMFSPDKYVEAPSFLRTHPATDDRVAQLKELAKEMEGVPPRYVVNEPAWYPSYHRSIVPRRRSSWGGWWR